MPTVLVVDDDDSVREAIAALLASEGYEPVLAADGREAFTLLRSGRVRPAVILLDLMMPAMDGWEFRAEQLADEELAGIPVIIFSAYYTQPQMTAAAMRAVAGFRKPVDPDQLLAAIGEQCARDGQAER